MVVVTGGGGDKCGHPSIQTVKNLVTFRSYFFLNFQQISFKVSNYTNFKAGRSLPFPRQKFEKDLGRVYYVGRGVKVI